MSMPWMQTALDLLASGAVVRVTVIRAEGSTPRDAGTSMLVTELGQSGTIGGGALEFEAVKAARRLFDAVEPGNTARWVREVREYPLGPQLCQCCGGFAWVLFEVFAMGERAALREIVSSQPPALIARQLMTGASLRVLTCRHALDDMPEAVIEPVRAILTGSEPARVLLIEGGPSTPAWFVEPFECTPQRLYLYGAGHVGRAIVRVTEGLGFEIHWVDTGKARFPDDIPSHARCIISATPDDVAASAQADAFHLVMTYSHPMDESICRALLLRNDFAFLGLIGSKTKRARFVRSLRNSGVPDAALQRLVSPIGIGGLTGKEPVVIAVSVAAQLLLVMQAKPTAKAIAKPREMAQLLSQE
jgi:xanthine dehydrogenase accessory factor